jgi:MoxR-like ATPase
MDKSDVLGSILPVTDSQDSDKEIEYKYFPSEIVRAFTQGYILEIQEPTVIRDAAVLMILNSALEPDGTINLPTGVVHRHPDFVAVITTNRNYIGCRPLNEALRDRIQHSEKMDLPEKEVMIERAMAKTGFDDIELTSKLVDAIITLDECATANAIRGVAGMRSLFFWVDAIKNGADIRESMYYKVIYKMTTNPDEIILLEESVDNNTSLFIEIQRRR